MKTPPKPNWYWTFVTYSNKTSIILPRWWNGQHWSCPALTTETAEQAAKIANVEALWSNAEITWSEIK